MLAYRFTCQHFPFVQGEIFEQCKFLGSETDRLVVAGNGATVGIDNKIADANFRCPLIGMPPG
jgi:hypothetical protein